MIALSCSSENMHTNQNICQMSQDSVQGIVSNMKCSEWVQESTDVMHIVGYIGLILLERVKKFFTRALVEINGPFAALYL